MCLPESGSESESESECGVYVRRDAAGMNAG